MRTTIKIICGEHVCVCACITTYIFYRPDRVSNGVMMKHANSHLKYSLESCVFATHLREVYIYVFIFFCRAADRTDANIKKTFIRVYDAGT